MMGEPGTPIRNSVSWQCIKGKLPRFTKAEHIGKEFENTITKYSQALAENNKKTAREIYSAYKQRNTSQLKAAWGPRAPKGSTDLFEKEQYSNELTTCWLCGAEVPEPKHKCPGVGKISSVCLGYPEAEHALFLKYGYLFLSIPNEIFLGSKAPWIRKDTVEEKVKELWRWNDQQYNSWLENMKSDYKFQIKLEMRQSHRLCNQLKNQINFIRFQGGPKGEWVIKEDLYEFYKKIIKDTLNDNYLTQKSEYVGWRVTGKEDVFNNNRLLRSLNDLINHLNCKDNSPKCILSYSDLPQYAKDKIDQKTFFDSSEAYKYVITRISTKFVKDIKYEQMEYSFNQAFNIFNKKRDYDNFEEESKQITNISYEATPGIEESSVEKGKIVRPRKLATIEEDSANENKLNKIQEELYKNNDVKETGENENDKNMLIGDLSRDGLFIDGTKLFPLYAINEIAGNLKTSKNYSEPAGFAFETQETTGDALGEAGPSTGIQAGVSSVTQPRWNTKEGIASVLDTPAPRGTQQQPELGSATGKRFASVRSPVILRNSKLARTGEVIEEGEEVSMNENNTVKEPRNLLLKYFRNNNEKRGNMAIGKYNGLLPEQKLEVNKEVERGKKSYDNMINFLFGFRS